MGTLSDMEQNPDNSKITLCLVMFTAWVNLQKKEETDLLNGKQNKHKELSQISHFPLLWKICLTSTDAGLYSYYHLSICFGCLHVSISKKSLFFS